MSTALLFSVQTFFLRSYVVGIGGNAVLVYVLALKGRHCLGVVLKGGRGGVGAAGAGVAEGFLRSREVSLWVGGGGGVKVND